VFIASDVSNYQASIIEDFLENVYLKLSQGASLEKDESDDLYEDFELARETCQEGTRLRQRVKLIREALHMRLKALRDSRLFLLLDGIDRIDSTLRILLENEIADLQDAGLSILLTSRLAVFEQDVGICDHRNHSGAPDDDPLSLQDREASSLFLICRTCGDLLCLECRDAGRICENW
jgi:anti-anti-sigma regulatory factor